jgi:mannosyltransferase
MRWPSCAESLWVDELHTSWVISGDCEQVHERATIGNQTPWYFLGLWWWTQFIGSEEQSLRWPSILAVAGASGLLVLTLSRGLGSLRMGGMAGVFLAIDASALFFGTEARVYAWILLVVSVALWGFFRIREWSQLRKWSELRTLAYLVLLFASLGFLAVGLHVTAGLTLGCMGAASCLWGLGVLTPYAESQRSMRFWRVLAVVAIGLAIVLAFAMHREVVQQAWVSRAKWASFATPRGLYDLWRMWSWDWLVIGPLAICGGLIMLTRLRKSPPGERIRDRQLTRFATSLVLVASVITGVAWCVANWHIAAIWHRRFIVGVLPMLCVCGAVYWELALRYSERLLTPRWHAWSSTGAIIAIVVIGMVSQGTLSRARMVAWANGDHRFVRRGEDWRGAVALVRRSMTGDDANEDLVAVASELIESEWLDRTRRDAGEKMSLPSQDNLTELQQDYLAFPIRGLYPLPGGVPLGPVGSLKTSAWLVEAMRARVNAGCQSGNVWLIIRKGQGGFPSLLRSMADGAADANGTGETVDWGVELEESFGRVTVLKVVFHSKAG